jgi:hypothetical protein
MRLQIKTVECSWIADLESRLNDELTALQKAGHQISDIHYQFGEMKGSLPIVAIITYLVLDENEKLARDSDGSFTILTTDDQAPAVDEVVKIVNGKSVSEAAVCDGGCEHCDAVHADETDDDHDNDDIPLDDYDRGFMDGVDSVISCNEKHDRSSGK